MIITISGAPGSGKSSVARELARRLGLRHYSIGELRRRVAHERGMTLQEYNRLGETTDETDREPDEYQARLGREEDDFVIDSRLGFHFIPHSFKVRLEVDAQVGAERIYHARRPKEQAERPYGTVDEVARADHAREASDRKRYQMYYCIDARERRHYDLVVDTSDKSVDQVADLVVGEIRRPEGGQRTGGGAVEPPPDSGTG